MAHRLQTSFHLLVYFLIQIISISLAQSSFELSIIKGRVRGTKTEQATSSGKFVISFKDIPYAKPPIDKLRFKPPEEVDSWNDVKQDLGKYVVCPQIETDLLRQQNANITEDCLLLDVYVNRDVPIKDSRLFPVMVYFHGGGFKHGYKSMYGPKYLLDKDIVLVIVNYRLGVFGFLSTKDNNAPGNVGLLDQAMALQWVKQNIRSFGGNPDSVTIFGHDAGAISVSLHLLSQQSSGTFSKAISSSGTALVPWALTKTPLKNAGELGDKVSCSRSELLKCLRGKKMETLLQAAEKLKNVTFYPVVDKWRQQPFLKDEPRILYEKGDYQKLPYLSGVMGQEGSLDFYGRYSEKASEKKTVDEMLHFLIYPYLPNTTNLESVLKAIKYQYLRGLNIFDRELSSEAMINILSDLMFKSGNDLAVKLHSNNGSVDTYTYVINYKGYRSLANLRSSSQRDKFGAAHMDDVFYIFDTKIDDQTKGQREGSDPIRNNYVNWWTQFALSGNPSNGFQRQTNQGPSFVEINDTSANFRNYAYRQSEMDFWNYLIPDLQSVTNDTNTDDYKHYQKATYGMVGLVVILALVCICLVAVIVIHRRRTVRFGNGMMKSSSMDMTEKKV